ncbi:MAG: elongation factor P [Candidatus Omnitrophica bacterium]|nr:elongation factor P [Candidatus Omnitrophota bacterium]
MISANELKRKAMIMIDGEPYQVLEVFIALPSARGASTMVRVKIRHLLSGLAQDRTFKAADKFIEADVDIVDAHFLYKDADAYYFMDQNTFETLELSQPMAGDLAGYLIEELAVKIMMYNGAPASLELPPFVNMKVTQTDAPIQQAGSAGGGTKNATLASGLVVKVPQYIVAGETVRVNTQTGEVSGRA